MELSYVDGVKGSRHLAYDEAVAARVRKALKGRKGIEEKKMFGGAAFMLNGHMCCGVQDKDLVLRLGKDGAAEAIEKRHVRPMDFTGKPLKSMVYIAPAGFAQEADLKAWLHQAVTFVRSLPPK
jgi:TfoX/Sxy family transcriptional regulator of competence genes